MENNNNEEQQEVKWGGLINEFLWMCAGVNRKVLRQCPTDYAKYAGVGGTILFTALMAMLSSGYALYTVFNDQYIAMAFGIFWGLMIFNLDRYMVNTMYSDGKHTISKEELKGAAPRLILAFFLGIVISTPVEMKIFEDVIAYNLPEIKAKAISKFEEEKAGYLETKNCIKTRMDSLKKVWANPLVGDSKTFELLKDATAKYYEAQKTAQKELLEGGHGRGRGPGNVYRELKEKEEIAKALVERLQKEYKQEQAANTAQVNTIRSRISIELKQDSTELAEVNKRIAKVDNDMKDTIDGLGKFSARLEAMYKGTSYHESWTLFIARIMVMLLFIVLEIIPVMFKIMEEDGPYDDKLRALRYEVKILADKKISDINDEVNTSVEISTAQNQDRLAAEVAANKELLTQIAQAQADILSEAIALWREEELKKVRENPSAYIQSSLEDPLDIQQSGRNV